MAEAVTVKKRRYARHGMSRTQYYEIHRGMKQRCENENNKDFAHYGGRGVSVCDRWKTFDNFYEDLHQSYLDHVEIYGAENTSIDRINSNGNYEPRNIRWATRDQQAQNRSMSSNNSSGFTGVSWNKAANKWRVDISGEYLGLFGSKETA